MPKSKHLTLSERITIEKSLKDSMSFKAIARLLDRDCTSIAKEVKKHIVHKKVGCYGKPFNDCIHRFDCQHSYICGSSSCRNRFCRFCPKCYTVCPDYEKRVCSHLSGPPYVCNGCSNLRSCTLEKSMYIAEDAQREYKQCLSESRKGISIDEQEVLRLDKIITPLIKKGQSLHHICSNNRDAIMHSEKTIYNYVNYGIFTARNIDLPRKVRYRPITDSQFMLAFIREANTSQSVIDIFDNLYQRLGSDTFRELFPVILTDNGSEFSNPSAIEFDKDGKRRTRIFYCDPSRPYQKGAAENNHELIRRVIPKGHSFDMYEQEDITLMMNHINSYGRRKLNDWSPYSVFSFLHGTDVLQKLDVAFILPDDIILNPTLLGA